MPDPGCIPCIIKQAYNSAKMFTSDIKLQEKIIREVCEKVSEFKSWYPAPYFSVVLQSIIENNIGRKNIYSELKIKNVNIALKYVKYLETLLEESTDRLETAVRISITGNVIDISANPFFNLNDEINRITSSNIFLNDLSSLKDDLKKAKTILFIADNYEEAVFDKIFIKELLPLKVIFAVRSKPIFNDITFEDAKNLELDKISKIIKTGCEIAGIDLKNVSDEFKKVFESADVVISKGQGNYETLMNVNRPVYFLLKVKCEPIAEKIGYNVGTGVLYLKR